MQLLHATWRENVGSILIGIGVITLICGLGSITLAEHGFLPTRWEWIFTAVWPFAIVAGFWLHITRSRRRVNIDVPPRDAAPRDDQVNHFS